MQAFAGFIMRGRWQAILIVLAASSLPFLSWLAGAVLALVTLRRGVQEGLLIAVIALVVMLALFGIMGVPPAAALRPAVELWLPVLLASYWLRRTVSLSSTLRLLSGLAALGVVGFHLVVADPDAFWRGAMVAAGQVFTGGAAEAEQAWAAMIEQMLPVLTGLLAATMLTMVIVGLLLGRAMQAALYNPGGFRSEFHALNLGRPWALVGVIVVAGALLAGPGLLTDLLLVLGLGFVLQTLAVAHAVVAARGWSGGWLLVVYALVPLAFQVLMIAGIADAAFNWRQRLVSGSGPDGSA